MVQVLNCIGNIALIIICFSDFTSSMHQPPAALDLRWIAAAERENADRFCYRSDGAVKCIVSSVV